MVCWFLVVQRKLIYKIESALRRILRAIGLKKKRDLMVNVLADHKILNVFELFMVEVIQELFKQIRKESSLELSLTFTTGKSINTRRTGKGLLD